MAFIHVIVPVYNAKNYICETITSVLTQPCRDIHIVLVDDGSTDGSAKLCDDIAQRESRVSVIHQENGGVSAARNAGIEYVLKQEQSGYIAFLDADDLWMKSVFSSDFPSVLSLPNSTHVICFGSICCNADVTQFTFPLTYEMSHKEGGNGAVWSTKGSFCANLYSIELLRKYRIRFMEGLKYSEDKIFNMQCLFLSDTVYFRPEILHIYRENTSSAMHKVFVYSPIEYYTPIIDGWIASDCFMNSWESVSGKHCNAGKILAGIYFGDMSAEHYQRWRSHKKLTAFCNQHPHFDLYINMNPKDVSAVQYSNNRLHLAHPLLYRLKNRLLGIAIFVARLLLKLKPIYAFMKKRKYPLTSIPSNQ